MNPPTRRLFFALIAICLVLALVSQPGASAAAAPAARLPQAAQEGQPSCWALDLLVLVDQSSSMFDPQLRPNDPQGYRYKAVEELLYRLMINRWEECSQAEHRFGLVSFGLESAVSMPLTQLDISPEQNLTAWMAPHLEAMRAAENGPIQNGTDYIPAYKQAVEMLQAAPPLQDPAGYGPRRQVVVLVTDGNPTTDQGTPIEMVGIPDYMGKLVQYLAEPAWNPVHLYFVALHSDNTYLGEMGASDQTVEDNWNGVVSSHHGKLYNLTYNEQTIPAALYDIIDNEFGHNGRVVRCGESFSIDPYSQELEFTFFHREEDASLSIRVKKLDNRTQEPIYEVVNNEEHRIDPAQVGEMKLDKEQTLQTKIKLQYTIDLPAPGLWTFSVDGLAPGECQSRVEAREKSLVADAVMVTPAPDGVVARVAEPPYYETAQPMPIVLELKTDKGAVIRQDAGYPLNVTAALQLPSGATALPDGSALPTYTLTETDPGHWTSGTSSILTPEEGRYTLRVTGTTSSGDNSAQLTLLDKSFTFYSQKSTRLAFQILSPVAQSVVACNSIANQQKAPNPVNVQVQVVDSGGAPFDLAGLLAAQPGGAFTAEFADATQVVLDQAALQPGDRPGLYTGSLMSGLPPVAGCGNAVVRVTFTGSFATPDYALPVTSQEVVFRRETAEALTARIVSPQAGENLPLHANLVSACPGGSSQAVRLELAVSGPDGQPVAPDQLAALAGLFEARLYGPDNSMIELTLLPGGAGLVAEGGSDLDEPGAYGIEVLPKPGAFAAGYIAAVDQPLRVSFVRQDGFSTRPSTCTGALGLGLVLLLGIAALLVWAFTGGPGGVLEFVAAGRPSDVRASVRLSKARIFHIAKNSQLTEIGVKKVEYKKIKPEQAPKAVYVTITDTNNEVTFTGPIEEDEINPYNQDYDLVYR